MTATLQDPFAQPKQSLADELRRIADWLEAHDATRDVLLLAWPPTMEPHRPFRVMLHQFDDFRRLFAGREVQKSERDTSVKYHVVIDDIEFEATTYVRREDNPATVTVTL